MEQPLTDKAIKEFLEDRLGPTSVMLHGDRITIAITPKSKVLAGDVLTVATWVPMCMGGYGYEFHSMIVTTDSYVYALTKKRT